MKKLLFLVIILVLGAIVYSKSLLQVDTLNDINNNWQQHAIEEVGLTFQAPKDVTVTWENPDESAVNLYAQRGSMQEGNYYQLYGIFRMDSVATEEDLENVKEELNSETVKNIVIDGYKAVEGQVKGERNRFVAYILKDKNLFTLATSQPTKENKELTDKILSTFDFK
ncbi:MAG: hypothetical protein Q8P26_03755 [Candidatus Levybacteria bacterium]|nr:hypothetical protein [Candidatus Levybacteria bacterium]